LQENTSRMLPSTFYGQTKLAFHDILMASARRFGFSAATGRVFLLYGPEEGKDRLIPIACQKLLAGQVADFSSGNQIRDFLHVDDVASGFMALLSSQIEGPCNISSGKGIRIGEVVNEIGDILGRPDLIRLGALADRPNEPKELVGDATALRAVGWQPQWSLKDGLENVIDYWREQQLKTA
jgi:nucleoside-diphosphate-sugar epimerase